MFKEIWERFELAQTALYDYFGIPQECRNRKIEDNTDSFWTMQGNSLMWANTKKDLLDENCYSLDDDNCDEAIYGTYETGGRVAVLVGCGEHTTPEMWILKSENRCNFNEDET